MRFSDLSMGPIISNCFADHDMRDLLRKLMAVLKIRPIVVGLSSLFLRLPRIIEQITMNRDAQNEILWNLNKHISPTCGDCWSKLQLKVENWSLIFHEGFSQHWRLGRSTGGWSDRSFSRVPKWLQATAQC